MDDTLDRQSLQNQDLNSDNIMANNSVVQLKHALETEKEKMTAAEQAIKQTTDSVLSLNSKQVNNKTSI